MLYSRQQTERSYIENLANYASYKDDYAHTKAMRNLLADDWSPVNKDGKIMTRLKNMWYKKYKTDLPEIVVNAINYYLAGITPCPTEYRISDNLRWNRGQYGDPGSCFWSSEDGKRVNGARAVVVAMGGMALQFRDEERAARDSGLARMWLLPYNGAVWGSNLYGTVRISYAKEVLAKHFGTTVEDAEVDIPRYKVPGSNAIYNFSCYRERVIVGKPQGKTPPVSDACACVLEGNFYGAAGARICHNCPFGKKSEE
jgi:hypothetical protein